MAAAITQPRSIYARGPFPSGLSTEFRPSTQVSFGRRRRRLGQLPSESGSEQLEPVSIGIEDVEEIVDQFTSQLVQYARAGLITQDQMNKAHAALQDCVEQLRSAGTTGSDLVIRMQACIVAASKKIQEEEERKEMIENVALTAGGALIGGLAVWFLKRR